MTASAAQPAGKLVLVVGVGGLGCPASLSLARAGARLLLCDDDTVDVTNLHRQILFDDSDVGCDKLDVARRALLKAGAAEVQLARTRLLPETALDLAASADIILEGSDNFGTKFLAADAAHLAGKHIVHGAAVQWRGTAWAVSPAGSPCYRCLFEDVPAAEDAPNCAEAGVVGPMVGVVGALMADLALDLLAGDTSRVGKMHSYDGEADVLRGATIHGRPGCPLCGQPPTITAIDEARYWAPLGEPHAC